MRMIASVSSEGLSAGPITPVTSASGLSSGLSQAVKRTMTRSPSFAPLGSAMLNVCW